MYTGGFKTKRKINRDVFNVIRIKNVDLDELIVLLRQRMT